MIPRPFWLQRIEEAWRQAPIAWLCGVRRCGKTTLAESLGAERTLYLNCDLPTVEDMVSVRKRGQVRLRSAGDSALSAAATWKLDLSPFPSPAADVPEAGSGGRVLDGRQQATPVVTTGAVGAPPNRSTR